MTSNPACDVCSHERGVWTRVCRVQTMCARFGSTCTEIGPIQRRLAWPLRKDDTQICEWDNCNSIINKSIKKKKRRRRCEETKEKMN